MFPQIDSRYVDGTPGVNGTWQRGYSKAPCWAQCWFVGVLLLMVQATLMAQDDPVAFIGVGGDNPAFTFNLLRGFNHAGDDNEILLDTYRPQIAADQPSDRGPGRTAENFCSFETYAGRSQWITQAIRGPYYGDSETVTDSDYLEFTDGDYRLETKHFTGSDQDIGGTYRYDFYFTLDQFEKTIGETDTACDLYYSGNESDGIDQLTNPIYGVANYWWYPDGENAREAIGDIVINFVYPEFVTDQPYSFDVNVRDDDLASGGATLGELEFDFDVVHSGYSAHQADTFFLFAPGQAKSSDCDPSEACYDSVLSGDLAQVALANYENLRIRNFVPSGNGKAILQHRWNRNNNTVFGLVGGDSYTLSVTGYAGGDFDSKLATELVLNAHDIQFTELQQYTFDVNVNHAATSCDGTARCGVIIGTIQAFDTAGNDTDNRYYFTGSALQDISNQAHFGYVDDTSINPNLRIVNGLVTSLSGEQSVIGELYYIGDIAQGQPGNPVITAQGGMDSGGNVRTVKRTFIVNVRDLDFNQDSYHFSMPQGGSGPIVLGTITASRPRRTRHQLYG